MPNNALLFGKLLDSQTPGMIVFDVAPTMGDAPSFKLAGQITLLERQCVEISQGPGGAYDVLRIPEHIARLKSDLAGNVRGRKKRKG